MWIRIGLSLIAAGMLLIGMTTTAQDEAVPSYYPDIQPIIEAHCLTCHFDGGIAPFSLQDPLTAQLGAPDIADTILSHEMPPWLPAGDTPLMRGQNTLTQEQIDLVLAWNAGEAPMGDPAQAVTLFPFETPTIRTDLTFTLPIPYQPDSNRFDDYRCFLLVGAEASSRFISGYAIEAGGRNIVHRAALYLVSADAAGGAAAQEGADGRPGWPCYGGPNVGRTGRTELLTAWMPDSQPVVFPEGGTLEIPPDTLLILHIQYNLEEVLGDIHADQTRVHFQLAEDAGAPVNLLQLTAPVEIPCPGGNVDGACSRDTAFLSVGDIVAAQTRAEEALTRCNRTLDEYLAQADGFIQSTCDMVIEAEELVLAITPRMHTFGRRLSVIVNPDSANPAPLLDIPRWDVYWSNSYQYVEPVLLKAGDVLRLTCTWDNTNSSRYIIVGDTPDDEQCFAALTVMTQP